MKLGFVSLALSTLIAINTGDYHQEVSLTISIAMMFCCIESKNMKLPKTQTLKRYQRKKQGIVATLF